MDERDLYKALASSRRAAGVEFLKQAGIIKDFAKKSIRDPRVVGGLIGAATLAGSELIGNRKDPKTGKTVQQMIADKGLEAANSVDGESFRGGMARGTAQLYKSFTDTFAKHPRAAALLAAGAGASLGSKIGPRAASLFGKGP